MRRRAVQSWSVAARRFASTSEKTKAASVRAKPSTSATTTTAAVASAVAPPKYTDRYGDLLSVSSEVMKTIIAEALQRRDHRTLHAVIEQARQVGRLSSEILEDALRQCLAARDLDNAAVIFEMSGRPSLASSDALSIEDTHAQPNITVSPALCQTLLHDLVDHYRWPQAASVLEYMLKLDMQSSGDREVFHIIGGLMRTTAGVTKALQLLTLVTQKRRGDLALVLSYKKVNRFALNHSIGRAKDPLPRQTLEQLAAASIEALQQRWFSFAVSKMLIALACGSGHHDVALDYIKTAVGILAQRMDEEKAAIYTGAVGVTSSESGGAVDMLSLLRCFSQAAGVASDNDESYRGQWVESPASSLVLDLAVEQLKRGNVSFSGPLKTTQFMHMYWVLCFRSRAGASVMPAQSVPSGGSPGRPSMQREKDFAEADDGENTVAANQRLDFYKGVGAELIDSALQGAYDDLTRFMQSDRTSVLLRPVSGYQRRAMRVLCDELGLRHQVGKFETPDDVVKVWRDKKYDAANLTYPPLPDILAADVRRGNAMRKFDGLPKHWSVVSNALSAMPAEALHLLLPSVLGGMTNYSAPEWALLAIEVLALGNDTSAASTSLLRSALKMCSQRNDVYALLEVLHLNATRASPQHHANSTNSLTNSSTHQEARRLRGESASSSSSSSSQHFSGLGQSAMDDSTGLRESDWNLACHLAYHSRVANMPAASYDAAFTEVVRLMRESGVEFDESTMRTLLRYLVYSQPHSELTARITNRLYKDKSLHITHIECAALTLLSLRRLSQVYNASTKSIVLSKPLYQAPAYLLLYPEAYAHILDVVVANSDFLGENFLSSFEAAWAAIHTRGGRLELYKLVARTVSGEGRRQALVHDEARDARSAVSILALYAAFLVSFHEGEHRRAYDLLYACESLNAEAKAAARDRQERKGDDRQDDDEEDKDGEGGEKEGRAVQRASR